MSPEDASKYIAEIAEHQADLSHIILELSQRVLDLEKMISAIVHDRTEI